jgi:hypothetical protein
MLLVPEVVIGVVATSCPNELITFKVPPFKSVMLLKLMLIWVLAGL